MATAACVANRRGKTIGILTEALGPYASTWDAAYKLLTLTTTLAILTLHKTNSIREIKIFSTNPTLPAQCLDRDTSNQETNITDFTQALKNILDTYHHLRISISWSPPGKGLKTLA